jgi:hypothetical protein
MHETAGITSWLSDKGYRLTLRQLVIPWAIESNHRHVSADLRHVGIFGLCAS